LFSPLDISSSDVLPVSRWVPGFDDDDYRLTHLLILFWTWDNTFSNVIDRVLFLEDMRLLAPLDPAPNMEHTFCTPFLVMCLLTVSCVSADLYAPVAVNPNRITIKHMISTPS